MNRTLVKKAATELLWLILLGVFLYVDAVLLFCMGGYP